MWDEFYGAQPNPYGVEDFKRILAALEERNDGSPEALDLIERTREALRVEERGRL